MILSILNFAFSSILMLGTANAVNDSGICYDTQFRIIENAANGASMA